MKIKIKKLIDMILFEKDAPKSIIFNNKKYIYHKYMQDYYDYDRKIYLFAEEIDFFKNLEKEVEILKERDDKNG